ncbi:MAG: 3-isopropylmalate dehydratase small subunit [Cyanobacteria bacterium P01_C01_bin.89]
MSKISTVSGSGIPLRGDDIDTDRIIPARFLRCVTFNGLGEHVFADDRIQLNGDHPFDLKQHQSSKVLVVNRNFGCGSSREHAPQAIARWGIQTILGESFAEIFFNNCIAIGVPCVVGDREVVLAVQDFVEANPGGKVTVDLDTLTVSYGDHTSPVTLIEGARQAFLSGKWDSCGQLVAQLDSIRDTADQLPYVTWSSIKAEA